MAWCPHCSSGTPRLDADPERFAGKWCTYLASATVARHDVLAFFNGERDCREVECIVDPATLRDVRTDGLVSD